MKKYRKNPKDNDELQKAIKFLVFSIEKSGKNPKPVITHSIRTAFYLDYLGYSKDTVIAGLLHDLPEDSEVTLEDIEDRFGEKVRKLVASCTFDKKIEDKTERYKDSLDKAVKSGKEALVLRAADLLDNSHYYHLVKDEETYKRLLDKLDYFLQVSKKIISKEKVYKDLFNNRKALNKEVRNNIFSKK